MPNIKPKRKTHVVTSILTEELFKFCVEDRKLYPNMSMSGWLEHVIKMWRMSRNGRGNLPDVVKP